MLKGTFIASIKDGWFRAMLFSLIWLILVDANWDSWLFAVPVVLISTYVSILLLPSFSISIIGLIRFIPYFLWHSLRGGLDVAIRVFQIKLQISPAIVSYQWRLPPGISRVFMANVTSLLPGTLSVELEDELLYVHVLDESIDYFTDMQELEERIAQMLGICLNNQEKNQIRNKFK